MANDNTLQVRVNEELKNDLDLAIKEVQEQTPESNVNASTIARYALEKYINDRKAKKDGTKMIIEIDTKDINFDDINSFYLLICGLLDKYFEEPDDEWGNNSIKYLLTSLVGALQEDRFNRERKKYK